VNLIYFLQIAGMGRNKKAVLAREEVGLSGFECGENKYFGAEGKSCDRVSGGGIRAGQYERGGDPTRTWNRGRIAFNRLNFRPPDLGEVKLSRV
jgi:hypothetical protein